MIFGDNGVSRQRVRQIDLSLQPIAELQPEDVPANMPDTRYAHEIDGAHESHSHNLAGHAKSAKLPRA